MSNSRASLLRALPERSHRTTMRAPSEEIPRFN
jgi:hypothetical protein